MKAPAVLGRPEAAPRRDRVANGHAAPASEAPSHGGLWCGLAARPAYLMLGVVALAALLIQGGVFIHKSWLWTGDTIYHRALMAEIMNGELLPGGPYAGLPAFYSPLTHLLAAGLAMLFRLDPLDGNKFLSMLAAPATPLVAYYVARVLGFDRAIALLGALFATFGGGLKHHEERVWVDALFTAQHNFFPLFPRDPAFLLLPLGLAWVYKGLVEAWRPGPYLAGLVFGLMILAHTQTAVFAAPLIGIFLLLLVGWRRDLLWRAVRDGAVTAGLTVLVSAPWWIPMVVGIARGDGYFDVRMPPERIPVKLDWREFPLEFGVFLPLGLLGIALTARLLVRQRSAAALLLLVWWAFPVVLALARPTDFPGGDTFFPRRLWQFASQPLAIMAAYGLLAGVLGLGRWPRSAALGALVATGVLACVPNSAWTWQRIGEFWNDTTFADVEWDRGGSFAYGDWLAARARQEGPRTVMVPTPDATMVWYLAGQKVVYLYPTAAIKLAFDVGKLTGFDVDQREDDLIRAYHGHPDDLTAVAHKYGAAYVVLRRDGDRLGAVDLPARGMKGERKGVSLVQVNHYEWLPLGEDDKLAFSFYSPVDGTATVQLRARRRSSSPRISSRLVVNGTEFPIAESETPRDGYAEITRAVPIQVGWNDVRLQTSAALELARFVAYATPIETYLDRFNVVYEDAHTIILAPRER